MGAPLLPASPLARHADAGRLGLAGDGGEQPMLDLVARLADDPQARQRFFAALGPEENIDLTDGLRVFFASGDIVHLRPSGNAPELRCYGESDQAARAAGLVKDALARALASLR